MFFDFNDLSIELRNLKGKLVSPPTLHTVQTLTLTPDEQTEYRKFLAQPIEQLSTEAQMTRLSRICADISKFLNDRGHHKDSVRMDSCRPGTRCNSAYCLRCIRARAISTRLRVHKSLAESLASDINLEVWFLTGCAADSEDVTTHARSAVRGMNRLFKHKRLRNRIVGTFSALEVAPKTSLLPCAHVHSLMVTRPITVGKYRISEAQFLEMWEESCEHHRPRLNPHEKMLRRNAARKKPHLSFVALQVLKNALDITRTADYLTKEANAERVIYNHEDLLLNPDNYIDRIQQLRHTTRFSGSLLTN